MVMAECHVHQKKVFKYSNIFKVTPVLGQGCLFNRLSLKEKATHSYNLSNTNVSLANCLRYQYFKSHTLKSIYL